MPGPVIRQKRKSKKRKKNMPKRAFITLILKISGNVNADMAIGTRIPLKKIITWNQEAKAFVSSRCIRRCIRERLYEKGFKVDPFTVQKGVLADIGDPVKYIDDDLFGYLAAVEEKSRSGPIKIGHLISLRHTEVKVEFAGRFARDFIPDYAKEYPSPFEVELAEWLGRLGVIVSDKIGCFQGEELTKKATESIERAGLSMEGDYYVISKQDRKNRLKAFLEVLLYEGWQFPRGAQSPSVPEYYYSAVALTRRFVPIFGHFDINDEGNLDQKKIGELRELYEPLMDALLLMDYRTDAYIRYEREGEELKEKESGKLDAEAMKRIIEKICNYIIS